MSREDAMVPDAARARASDTQTESEPESAVRVRTGRMRIDTPARAGAATEFAAPIDYRTIRGIIPTVLTPFDDSDQVDDAALRAEVQYLVEAGVHGLLVMGSFGECPYLGDDDREVVIRTTVSAADRTTPVLVGITAESTFVAAEQIRQAARLGAAAVVVCLPQYFQLKFDDIKQHYAQLSELDVLPIFYYHYPSATRLNLKAAQVAELLTLRNVVGIKETTFDLLAIRRHIQLTRESGRIFLSGSELNFVQFMELGGHGVISAGSLIMPRVAVAMYEAYQTGDKAKAKELQGLLFETMPLAKDVRAPVPLVRTAFGLAMRQGLDVPLGVEPAHARLKAALARRGLPISPRVRSPLPQLTPRDAQAVEQAMDRIEKLEK